MQNQSEKSSTKTYSLTAEETGNLDARMSVMRPYDYILHLIATDIQNYKDFVVCKRIGIEGKNYTVSPDNKTLTLVGGENEKENK